MNKEMTDQPTDYNKAAWDAELHRYLAQPPRPGPQYTHEQQASILNDDPFDGPEWHADKKVLDKLVDELIAELQGTRRMLFVACLTLIGTVSGGLAALRWLV